MWLFTFSQQQWRIRFLRDIAFRPHHCESRPDAFPSTFLINQALLPLSHFQPEKDSAMANDVIIHEFAHGLSGRLVGGGTASCIQTLEARGLGEGWSDAIAEYAHILYGKGNI